MTNLEDKFEALETQIAQQHTALITALTATNSKLDAIIEALGGAPPTATVTLQDVIDAIGTQTAIVADIHLDTMSIDGKMLTIRDTLDDVHTDTVSIDQKLQRIRDAIAPLGESFPAEAHSSVLWSLYRIMDAINPTWPRPVGIPLQPALEQLYEMLQPTPSQLEDIWRALGQNTGDATMTVLGRLTHLELTTVAQLTSLGLLAEPAAGTVLQLLQCICDAEQRQLPIDPLDPNNPDGCTEPYTSTSMWLGAFGTLWTGGNVIIAVWAEPLPEGVTFGTTFGIGTDYTELNNDDWSGWRVFVQSDEDQYAESPTDLTRYPTNQWRPLSGSGAKAFSVSERGSIRVYLCSPEAVIGGDIITDMVCDEYTTSDSQLSFTTPTEYDTYMRVIDTGDRGTYFTGSDGSSAVLLDYSVQGVTTEELLSRGVTYTMLSNGGAYCTIRVCGAPDSTIAQPVEGCKTVQIHEYPRQYHIDTTAELSVEVVSMTGAGGVRFDAPGQNQIVLGAEGQTATLLADLTYTITQVVETDLVIEVCLVG